MNKVTVIIPVYNTERYIGRCAESLFSQTYSDIEYIFVDDCSPDRAIDAMMEVLSRFPGRKAQVKVIRHERNTGVEEARISGLKVASGDYIAFTDSDDFIDRDMIEVMVGRAVDTDADIVVCDIMQELSGGRQVYLVDYVSDNPDDWLRDIVANNKSYSNLHNKMYRASLFASVTFPMPRIVCCEDWSANIQLYHAAKRIVHIPCAMDHYVMYNTSSITRTKNARHFSDIVIFWHRVDDFVKQWGLTDEYADMISQLKLGCKASLMLAVDDADLRRRFKDMFPECENYRIGRHPAILRKGERLTLWLLRHRMYRSINILRNILIWKSKLKR